MPGGDGTGPMGRGALTGRGLGNCLAYGIPAIAGMAAAFGFGRRRGWFGRGSGRMSGFGQGFAKGLAGRLNQESSLKEEELTILKQEAKSIQDRITELEKE